MNVHEIKPRKNGPLIEELRKLLEQAETGQLQSMAWVAIKAAGVSENGCLMNGGTDAIAMLGEGYLMVQAMARMCEGGLEMAPE